MEIISAWVESEKAINMGIVDGFWPVQKRTHVALCVAVSSCHYKYVYESLGQRGALLQQQDARAVTTLHHGLTRKKVQERSGNEAVVILSQAILLCNVDISDSAVHQRGISSPSVWLSVR